MKNLIITLLILAGSLNMFAQQDTLNLQVTKSIDIDIFEYVFDYEDSLCDTELIGTFRWACMKAAMAPSGTIVVIIFNIQGTAPHTIQLLYELPMFERQVIIDGTTQPGYQPGTPAVIIDGMGLIDNGLVLYKANNSEIKGLHIRNFLYSGIFLNQTENTLITGNVVNNIYRELKDMMLGEGAIGILSSPVNIISSNIIGSVLLNDSLKSKYGINLQRIPSDRINFPRSNGNIIGGDNLSDGNIITNTVRGVWVGTGCTNNRISRNSIYNNGSAIYLSGPDGLEPGGNYNKTAPVITSVNNGTVTGTSYQEDAIELFGSSGNENANEFIATAVCDSTGNWELQGVSTGYEYLVATATDFRGNSSEMSDTIPVFAPGPYCNFSFTETVFTVDGVPVQGTTLSVCSKYIFSYSIFRQANYLVPSPSDVIINLPNGIEFDSFTNTGNVTLTNSTQNSATFTVNWQGLQNPAIEIVVKTPSCTPVPTTQTSITESICQTTPLLSNNTFSIVAPTMNVTNFITAPQIISTGMMNEFVFEIFNTSSNNADISQIFITATPDPSIIFQGNCYITTSPSVLTPENANTYTIIPPFFSFIPAGTNIVFSPALPALQHYYLHVPYYVDPSAVCNIANNCIFNFSLSCDNEICSDAQPLSTNFTLMGGNPSLNVTAEPFENATFCTAAGTNDALMGFKIKNNGTGMGQTGSAKATNMHLYVYYDNTIGSATGFAINNVPVASNCVPAGNITICEIDLENMSVIGNNWNPFGNSPADWDYDGYIDDLMENGEFIITAHYQYNTDCPTGLHTNTCPLNANILSIYVYYNDQCMTMPPPPQDVLTLPPSATYSYTASAAFDPVIEFFDNSGQINDVFEPHYFTAQIFPGVLNEVFNPEGFSFNCPDGHHIMTINLPVGYHFDSSVPFSPSIDIMCNPLCNNTSAQPQTLHPVIDFICGQNEQPDILVIDLGHIESCDCGGSSSLYQFLDPNGGRVTIDIPLFFDCNFCDYPEPTGLTGEVEDIFSVNIQYICDDNCVNCAITTACGYGQLMNHCIGECSSFFGIAENVTMTRINYGFVNNDEASLTTLYPIFGPIGINTIVNQDRAYPYDAIRLTAEGSFNWYSDGVTLTPDKIVDMFLKVDIPNMPQPLFELDPAASSITITNLATGIPSVPLNVTLNIIGSSMYFGIDNSNNDLTNFLSTNSDPSEELKIEADLTIIPLSGWPDGWNYLYPVNEFGANVLLHDELQEVGCCDPYSTNFIILQPNETPEIEPVNITCEEFIIDFRLQLYKAFYLFDDFPFEFRNYAHLLPDVKITIPPGYQYLSSEFIIYESDFDVNGINNFAPLTLPAHEYPIPPAQISLNPVVTLPTITFNGIDPYGTWLLADMKRCLTPDYEPMYCIRVHLQPPCNPSDLFGFEGSYIKYNNSPYPQYQEIVSFNINQNVPLPEPSLLIATPPAISVTGSDVSFNFTVCNTSNVPANSSWVSIENNPAFNSIDMSTVVVTGPACLYTDANSNPALFFDIGVIGPFDCVNFTLTGQLNQNAACIYAEQDITLTAGNQCGSTFQELCNDPNTACPKQSVPLYFTVQAPVLTLTPAPGGIPDTPVDNCGGFLTYNLVISNSQTGSVYSPDFSILLPPGVTITNISFTYSGSTYQEQLPQDISWEFSQILGLTELTGIQTSPDNQIFVTFTLMFICYDSQIDQITFIAGGFDQCGSPVVSNTITHQPSISNAPLHDMLSSSVSPSSIFLDCGNSASITFTVTNNGNAATNYTNVLSVNVIEFDPVNVSGFTGGAFVQPGFYQWVLPQLQPQLQPGASFSTTFTVALPSPTPFLCPGDIIINPQLEFNGFIDCGGEYQCENSYNYSFPPFTINACCTCNIAFTTTHVSCYGGSDGSVTATHNGDAPFTYQWLTGENTQTLHNLAAGTYYVTITDASGCTASSSVTVNQPAAISPNFSIQNVLCFGGNNGSVISNTSGGTPGYTYSWSNSGTTNTISGLIADTYTVTITDSHNCSGVFDAEVTEPGLLQVNISANTICFGSSGAATANPTGGVTPYSYLWPGGQTTQTATNLSAGSYTVTVTDQNLCTATAQTTISEYSEIIIILTQTQSIACAGDNTAAVSSNVSGGTPPYSYSWLNGPTTPDISGLTSGLYQLTVTDANGCTNTSQILITEPHPLTTSLTGITPLCFFDATGSVNLTVTGGTTPYYYIWSTGATTEDLINVPGGIYSVTVTDNNGCTTTATIGLLNPPPLNITISQTNSTCSSFNNGSATVSISGGTSPYNILWYDGSNSATISNLAAAAYTVTVTDANNCTVISSVTILDDINIYLSFEETNLLCSNDNNGAIDLTVSGNGQMPYTYFWNGPGGPYSTEDISSLTNGTYFITVTDNSGCSSTAQADILYTEDPPVAGFNVTGCLYMGNPVTFNNISLNATTYQWTFSDGTTDNTENPSIVFNDFGYYSVTLSVSNVCGNASVSQYIYVYEDQCPCISYDIPENFNDVNNPIVSTVNIQNQNLTVEGTIYIGQNGTLDILDSYLRFSPKGRIVVMRGGNLIINHSTLDRLDGCMDMWQGIEVWGDATKNSYDLIQGKAVIDNATEINYAHIGILLGRRNEPHNITHPMNAFDMAYSGGVVNIDKSFINTCGIGIKFTRKSDTHGNANLISGTYFNCGNQLPDIHYLITNSVTYPCLLNPWAGMANSDALTFAGVESTNIRRLRIINDCIFARLVYGIFTINNMQTTVSKCTFYNLRKGIHAENITSGILNSYTISECEFDFIPGTTSNVAGDDGTAIYISGGRGDKIFNGNQFFNTFSPLIPTFGIRFNNTSAFSIENNIFSDLTAGITINNSSVTGGGGYVRAYTGTGLNNWQGNVFNNCVTGITTQYDNSALCLRCNDHNTGAGYIVNWDNSNGTLADQGYANFAGVTDPIQHARYGAGNSFLPDKDISSISSYNYYHHSSPPQYTPVVTPSITRVDINIGVNSYFKYQFCPPLTSPPPDNNNLPASLYDPVFLRIDSLNNVVTALEQQYNTLLINADNGNTQQLLNAINAIPPSGQLKNMLIANSPLSDTVLIAFNVKNPLSHGNYKLVMEENLPVTRKVVPSFNERLETLPPGIRSQLQAKQANNPGKITLGYLETLLGQAKLTKQLYFNQIISLLLDTLNNRYEDAITLFEREGTDAANIALAASYISDSNYSAAAAKIALLPDDESEAGVWKNYATMLLNHFMQGKELEELDSLQIEFIRSLAYQCPEGLATVNAKAILMYLFRETVPPCQPNTIRNAKPENITIKTQNQSWLGDNYPDPFTRNTIIPYYLPEGEKGELFIKDVTGRIMMRLKLFEGSNKIEIETGKWADGLYFYEMKVNSQAVELKKMIKTE